VLLGSFPFRNVVRDIIFAHILFFEITHSFLIKAYITLSLMISSTELVLVIEPISAFFIFEEQIVIVILEHRIIRWNYELMERLFNLAQKLYLSSIVQVVL
jgi:hypothetical protein